MFRKNLSATKGMEMPKPKTIFVEFVLMCAGMHVAGCCLASVGSWSLDFKKLRTLDLSLSIEEPYKLYCLVVCWAMFESLKCVGPRY